MKSFNRIDSSEIKLGMRFSAPVFFDDGENMFLAEEKSVKQYHLVAIARWQLKTLLTFGHVLSEDEFDGIEGLDVIEDLGGVEEIEEIEEAEEVEEAEELESVSSK